MTPGQQNPPLADAIIGAVSRALETPLSLTSITSCNGGDINQALRLECAERVVFAKVHSGDCRTMFQAEADALTEWSQTRALTVPEPLAVGEHAGTSFLALSYLELGGKTTRAAQGLGKALARVHRNEQPFFGWHRDNTIGLTPQPNPPSDDWLGFFGEHRLMHQATLMARTGLADVVADCRRLVRQLPALFADYQPHPALLHGDLWGGNWGALAGDQPAVFDPASYYGDRETDLAMTELFGGFNTAFYQAYETEYTLDPGYPRRRPLYQLYHVMNHANLFGGGYLNRTCSMLRQLLEDTR